MKVYLLEIPGSGSLVGVYTEEKNAISYVVKIIKENIGYGELEKVKSLKEAADLIKKNPSSFLCEYEYFITVIECDISIYRQDKQFITPLEILEKAVKMIGEEV